MSLRNLPQLEELSISWVHLTTDGFETISALNNLRILGVTNVRVKDMKTYHQGIKLLIRSPSLDTMRLPGGSLQGFDLELLKDSSLKRLFAYPLALN